MKKRFTSYGNFDVDDECRITKMQEDKADYQPSIIEHLLHFFGKHIWTIGVEPKYCVYPGCIKGKGELWNRKHIINI